MKFDKRWFLLLAVAASAVVGAVVASTSRRRHRGTAHDPQYKTDLKSWENEGGNLAPAPVASVLP